MTFIVSGTLNHSLPEAIAAADYYARLVRDFGPDGATTYQPDQVAIEIVFVNVNPQSTLLLGQARGAAICGAVSCDLPVAEYTALQVKQAVVGHGKAAKEQVSHMVQRLLSLDGSPSSDAADALACAICHAHGSSGLAAMAGVGTRKRGGRLRL